MDFEQGLKLISDDIQAMELENYALSTNEEVHIYVDHIPIPITDVDIINPLPWINNSETIMDDVEASAVVNGEANVMDGHVTGEEAVIEEVVDEHEVGVKAVAEEVVNEQVPDMEEVAVDVQEVLHEQMDGVEIVHNGRSDTKSSDEDEYFICSGVEEDSLHTSLDTENKDDTTDVNSRETHKSFYFSGVAHDLSNLDDVDEDYLSEELDSEIGSNT